MTTFRGAGVPGSFRLAQGEAHTWCVDLDISPESIARLLPVLSSEERSRGARFRSAPGRRRFLAAHAALRMLLGRYLQIQPDRLRYVFNAFGKPDLSPEFGGRLKFNMSHSAGLALIVIAAESNVGVDLENLRAQPDSLEIAGRFFSAAEVDHLTRLPASVRASVFFTYWTRTEAYAKGRGEGLGSMEGKSFDIAGDRQWSVSTVRPGTGYIGAVATEGDGTGGVPRPRRMSLECPA